MYRSLGRIIAFTLIGSIFAGLLLIIMGAESNPTVIIWGLCLIIVPIVIIVVMSKVSGKSKKAMAQKEEWKKSISISDDGTITVRHRIPLLAKNIGIQEFTYYQKNYHDAEIVYTGVTRGGIHMGGFHTNPESQTKGNLIRTGKYELVMGVKTIIEKITLTGVALEDAKKDPFISRFLNGETLVLRHNIPESDLELSALRNPSIGVGSTLATATVKENLAGQVVTRMKLTKEECIKVRDWLGGQ